MATLLNMGHWRDVGLASEHDFEILAGRGSGLPMAVTRVTVDRTVCPPRLLIPDAWLPMYQAFRGLAGRVWGLEYTVTLASHVPRAHARHVLDIGGPEAILALVRALPDA